MLPFPEGAAAHQGADSDEDVRGERQAEHADRRGHQRAPDQSSERNAAPLEPRAQDRPDDAAGGQPGEEEANQFGALAVAMGDDGCELFDGGPAARR